jgi:hypothetical protein
MAATDASSHTIWRGRARAPPRIGLRCDRTATREARRDVPTPVVLEQPARECTETQRRQIANIAYNWKRNPIPGGERIDM